MSVWNNFNTHAGGASWQGKPFGEMLREQLNREHHLGQHIEIACKMGPAIDEHQVLRAAHQAARTLWSDYPQDLTKPVMAVLFASIAREVIARGQEIEFTVERRGYQQTVKPKAVAAPADGEWPVDWSRVTETQVDRLHRSV